MTNLNIFKNTLAFKPPKLSASFSNCSGHCHTEIQKVLPFWIHNQLFWTYRCLCCKVYQFEEGKTSNEQGGFYD